jgi:hypothetical protein
VTGVQTCALPISYFFDPEDVGNIKINLKSPFITSSNSYQSSLYNVKKSATKLTPRS